MRKIICTLLALTVIFGSSFAQTKDKKEKAGTTKETTKKAEKKPESSAPAKKEATGGEAKTSKTKKDGTPDMRFKENKEKKEAKPAGPTKKDGMPDKRYKANKDAKK